MFLVIRVQRLFATYLVADYFRASKEESNVVDVQVEPSGVGSDGGRDILVTLQMTDSILPFNRKWVVQCKFNEKAISKADLSDVNIPTLIHEYGANGYLLVCKNNVTAKISEMFENLRQKCRLGYSYEFWQGNAFKGRIRVKPEIIEQYFPEHNEYLKLLKLGN